MKGNDYITLFDYSNDNNEKFEKNISRNGKEDEQ
jgi:hypothetical protein